MGIYGLGSAGYNQYSAFHRGDQTNYQTHMQHARNLENQLQRELNTAIASGNTARAEYLINALQSGNYGGMHGMYMPVPVGNALNWLTRNFMGGIGDHTTGSLAYHRAQAARAQTNVQNRYDSMFQAVNMMRQNARRQMDQIQQQLQNPALDAATRNQLLAQYNSLRHQMSTVTVPTEAFNNLPFTIQPYSMNPNRFGLDAPYLSGLAGLTPPMPQPYLL